MVIYLFIYLLQQVETILGVMIPVIDNIGLGRAVLSVI